MPAQQSCDVLVVGDSTAMADFDPKVLQARSRLTACNIAEVRSIVDFVGVDEPLRTFLAHHAPPKYLIAAFTPNDFDPMHPRGFSLEPVGFEYGSAYDRGSWLWETMLRNPGPTLQWLLWVEQAMLHDLWFRASLRHAAKWSVPFRDMRDRDRGFSPAYIPPQTRCVAPIGHPPETTYTQNVAGVAAFRRKYETPGTRLLLYVTPVASCDPRVEDYRGLTRNLPDFPLQVRPIGDFNETNIHLTPKAAQAFSAEVGDQLRVLENRGR